MSEQITTERTEPELSVPDAVLRIAGDVILISDHENKLLLNRKAATELLNRLPGLIAALPPDAEPPNNRIQRPPVENPSKAETASPGGSLQ